MLKAILNTMVSMVYESPVKVREQSIKSTGDLENVGDRIVE